MALTSATLDRVLDKVGSVYVLRVGSETINDYGFASVTFTPYTVGGYVEVLTDRDQSVRAGLLNSGDARGYFKLTTGGGSVLVAGSKIEVDHQGVTYQMVGDPIIPHMSGAQLVKIINLTRKIV